MFIDDSQVLLRCHRVLVTVRLIAAVPLLSNALLMRASVCHPRIHVLAAEDSCIDCNRIISTI